MSLNLGPATIRAQQALSEKFGIPTFNLSGGLSTVPTSRPVSMINVGTGQFFSETTATLTTKLNNAISTLRQTGGNIGSTIFTPPEFAPATGDISGKTSPSNTSMDSASAATGTDKIIDSLGQFKTFLGPIGIGVLVLLAVLAVKKGN